MDIYDIVFSKYDLKTPFTALVRATLQRLLPASQLDKLFNDDGIDVWRCTRYTFVASQAFAASYRRGQGAKE
ncbi:MAG: hypothetical protein LBU65_01935 [Planctomycetaceae bacterium]|jgi:hypothetical protein|nr:hypothetical protein [Planctomycetaceae bacterium]